METIGWPNRGRIPEISSFKNLAHPSCQDPTGRPEPSATRYPTSLQGVAANQVPLGRLGRRLLMKCGGFGMIETPLTLYVKAAVKAMLKWLSPR